MIKHLPHTVLIFLISTFCYAEVTPFSSYDKIIERAMNNFWGRAKLKDGSTVQPNSQEERTALPITRKNAEAVIKAGELSGFADWCRLDWKQNYFRVTGSARSNGLNGKQVAFVGFLHGVAMGTVDSALKGKECTPKIKENVIEQLRKVF